MNEIPQPTPEEARFWDDAACLMRSISRQARTETGFDRYRAEMAGELANAFAAYRDGRGSPDRRIAKQREIEQRHLDLINENNKIVAEHLFGEDD